MRETVFLICAFVSTGVFAALPFATDRVNLKEVDALCILRDDNSMLMRLGANFNGNDVDKILALPGNFFDRYDDGTTNEVPCEYSGNLGTDDTITIESTVYLNGSPGSNPCGAKSIVSGFSLTGYEWNIQIREKYALGVYTDIDRNYNVKCFVENATSTFVTTTVQVYQLQDDSGNSQNQRPITTMSVDTKGEGAVMLNKNVNLQISTRQLPNRVDNLHHYGCYPYYCQSSLTPGGAETLFIGMTGCPATGDPFSLSGGFAGNMYTNDASGFRYFLTKTPDFVMARGRPQNDYYYLSCYVGYCIGAEGSDSKCTDYCQYNQNAGRRKRSILADADKVTLAVRIYDDDDEPKAGNNGAEGSVGDDDVSTTLIVVVAIAGLLFIVLASVAVCALCFICRRRSDVIEEEEASSTEGSTSNLPRHIKQQHFGPAKI